MFFTVVLNILVEAIYHQYKLESLATSMNDELKESALEMSQMLGESGQSDGGGMKLVYKKLDELKIKTMKEAEEDLNNVQTERANCAKTVAEASKLIESSSATTAKNNAQIKNDALDINKMRIDIESLTTTSSGAHDEFMTIPPQRNTAIGEAMQRIDERAKALSVITKATFVVCERFTRFKNSAQCLRIKAMPDVDEPPLAQQRTNETLKADKQSTREFEKVEEDNFQKVLEADAAKVEAGDTNPENLPSDEAVTELGEDDEPSEPLTDKEKPALKQVEALASEQLMDRVSTPMVELVIALKKGKRRKAINLVQILLDVKQAIYTEQTQDKEAHMKELDEFYDKAWQIQSTISGNGVQRENLETRSEEARVRTIALMEDNENQRKILNQQKDIKLNEEKRCARVNADYAMRVSIREEDLENLAKLKSLLRSLYSEEAPTACKKHNGQMCTGQDNGWCVFNDVTGDEQRCSCNYGFYGETCQFQQCPGLGEITYKSDDVGVCSDRGTCNHLTGMCETCNEGFYHGPKKACEYKHAPPSVNPDNGEKIADEKCSGHGEVDRERGICNCEYEWSGESCASKKCPNSNSVLYPIESANACDGRGACNDKTGECSCEFPYSGTTCEKKACPRECSNRGGCDESTGKCFCKKPFVGASCSFQQCPDDCNDGGWCDQITGKCLCKKGFSGERCLPSTRCTDTKHANPEANWYTQWDKPGWVTCPDGQALYGLYRNECNVLSCLESGKCAAPCEGEGDSATPIPVRNCYHALETYEQFDKEGWSKCDPNYYVTGLYRSCDSLYCLNMLKCCNFKIKDSPTRSIDCEEVNIASFDGRGWVQVPEKKFISGLYRGKDHTLSDLDKLEACGWTRGY